MDSSSLTRNQTWAWSQPLDHQGSPRKSFLKPKSDVFVFLPKLSKAVQWLQESILNTLYDYLLLILVVSLSLPPMDLTSNLCSWKLICFLPFSQLLEPGCTPWPLAPSIKLAMAGCVFSQCISLKLTPLSPPSYLEDPGDYIGPIWINQDISFF